MRRSSTARIGLGAPAAICLVAILGWLGQSASAAEKRFHVTVRDETGAALEDIVVGVRAVGKGAAAVTDAQGAATVTLDVDDTASLAVAWVDMFDLLSMPEAEVDRLVERAMSIPKLPPIEALVRLTPGPHDCNVELRYRQPRPLQGTITENGQAPGTRWDVNFPYLFFGTRIGADGQFRAVCPVGGDLLFQLYGEDSEQVPGRSVIVRVPAASIGPDGGLGVIDINPTIAATGNVTFSLTATPEQYDEVQAHIKLSYWGLVLISADGKTVMSFLSEENNRLANEPATMPVGTWYAVPGSYFCWTWTQRRIIEACLDGVDLSQSGIPRIVVTEGANLTVNIDPVAAELAIQAFFTPPPP